MRNIRLLPPLLGLLFLSLSARTAHASCDPAHVTWECFDSSVILALLAPGGEVHSLCSGVAINPQTLLTAAHCVHQAQQLGTLWEVHLGPNWESGLAPHSFAVPSQALQHPDYIHRGRSPLPNLHENDLGLVTLEPNQALPRSLHYPALPTRRLNLRPGRALSRIGFGRRNRENRRTWTDVRFRTYEGPKENGVLITDDRFAVSGDSGGPLYLPSPDLRHFLLLAVHSSSIPFPADGSLPSPLAGTSWAVSLPAYLDWIEQNAIGAIQSVEPRARSSRRSEN